MNTELFRLFVSENPGLAETAPSANKQCICSAMSSQVLTTEKAQ